MRFQIGIDVGGTFTDLVAIDQDGSIATLKVPSTPAEPAKAVLDALKAFQAQHPDAEIAMLCHSTTIATNALLGQVGLELPRVALITTAGFRDLIEIGRQNRSELYNLFVERPRSLVKRDDRLCIRERIDHRGDILLELNEDDVRAAINQLKAANIHAVAIGFLNSYTNADHERRTAALVADALPEISLTQSAEVNPEYREYERFSTAVVNAALSPIVGRYVNALREGVADQGIRAPLYVMQSHGGMRDASDVAAAPATIIESGPGSGVIAAAALAKRRGIKHVLSFDMGGTTAKAGTIIDGRVQLAHEFEAAGSVHGGRPAKGSGYPVRFPLIDLAEASAGGGTIASANDARALQVGPQSAGADPGPACYGKADLVTVTDANVVLGRLRNDALLGGTFPIEAKRSQSAIAALAAKVGLSPLETAAGIIRLVDNEMAKILRIVTVERGQDPRGFTLFAFGGNGPLHACAIAEDLDIRSVVVPPSPGLFSAFGLIVAPLQSAVVMPIMQPAMQCQDAELRDSFKELRKRAIEQLRPQIARDSAAFESEAFTETIDARYEGQSYELSVLAKPTITENVAAFHHAHAEAYGYSVESEPVEFVNLRVRASVPRKTLAYRFQLHPVQKPADRRRVWLDGDWRDVPVLSRDRLPKRGIKGPAIIDEYDGTTLIPQDWSATLEDDSLHLQCDR
ncbi:MAG: hydantoinase/oxoprolinase family protein [Candidatus Eremiobacteraeota bacterium]|nr:hydantoinase/oxoprolinase family protein [Candidatus Eremiobacteraeota bacterium]MBV9737030.1 hydantoinase/oxoprolinase family protein [Candidatus Eremiobacteraeota bacterium]